MDSADDGSDGPGRAEPGSRQANYLPLAVPGVPPTDSGRIDSTAPTTAPVVAATAPVIFSITLFGFFAILLAFFTIFLTAFFAALTAGFFATFLTIFFTAFLAAFFVAFLAAGVFFADFERFADFFAICS